MYCFQLDTVGHIETFPIRPVHQPYLRGAAAMTAMTHQNDLYFVLGDGSVAATMDRHGDGRDADGVFAVRARDLGPARSVKHRYVTSVVRPSGRVACWGDNHGEGVGATERSYSEEPLLVKLPASR